MHHLRIFLGVAFLLFAGICYSNKAEVVFMEHSIRWTNENRFPYYLKLPEVRRVLDSCIALRFKEKFGFESVTRSGDINYRVIDGFGSPKISWPKASSPEDHEIAILSAITRGTSNQDMFWSMEVSVRKAGNVQYTQAVNHQIVPHSLTYFMSNQRWMEPEEFVDFFLLLLDEALALRPVLDKVLPVNSRETARRKVSGIFPRNKRMDLVVADSLVGKSRYRIYQLREEDNPIETWIYRPYEFLAGVYRESFSGAFISSVLNALANRERWQIPIPDSYEVRMSTLEASSGEKWIIRQSEAAAPASAGGKPKNGKEKPVVAFELLDNAPPHSTLQSFVYIKEMNTNGEELQRRQVRMGGTYGTLGVTNTHIFVAGADSLKVEIIYPEQEGMLGISRNGQPVAIMSMINDNPASRQFFELQLYGKNRATVRAPIEPGIRSPLAQQYALYVQDPWDINLLKQDMRLLVLMLQSIDLTQTAPDALRREGFEF